MAEDKGKTTVEQAGYKGGETTAGKYGHEHVEAIGRKGGQMGGVRVARLIERGKQSVRR